MPTACFWLDTKIISLLDEAAWIGIPSVVLGERAAGLALLDHPAVETLRVDEPVASIYGDLIAALLRQGSPIPTHGIWIAATAIRSGSSQLTLDQHFRQISRLSSIILPSAL
ncbi:MAG: hypothetical protein B7X34_07515 [Acidobacteriia bacterium 12-62-4]|nr:MAG: hypothetical protein B7X34_07515 [Acidobacteriia bacterium 12-62-4]